MVLAAGCVPEGPKTEGRAPPGSAGSRTAAAERSPRAGPSSPPLLTAFEDRFERETLGGDYQVVGQGWRIVAGELCAEGARNRGVWLRRSLPLNARIEFDARSASPDGDIKAEAWGDGRSGATGSSYSNATSYLFILGGWKNTQHVLARLDEHGRDRLVLEVDRSSPDLQAQPVEPGQIYRFRIERSDGRTVAWSIDGRPVHELSDPEPLAGRGHDHFGFNDWMVRVCFDNLRATPL
ncbi:MAG: hypothetical protein HY744_01325 [Deltaproteobacteria bacterium]|nr:hypothetical protein [Deltaproteobacteria bacterium]